MSITSITVRISDNPAPRTFVGRFAWTLNELIEAGDRGVTSFERPAPRWSHYIYRLRRDGVGIVTTDEKHTGPYRGTHGRYRLNVPVTVVDRVMS